MGYSNKCTRCEKEWISSHPAKFCSSNCNTVYYKREARRLLTFTGQCKECNTPFTFQRLGTKFCSSVCNNAFLYKKASKSEHAVRKSKYNKTRPGIVAKQRKEKYHKDINFKMTCVLRARLNQALKNNYKSGSAVSDLGCSIEELKKHLESQFESGMTWDNWSRTGWHIDHINPLSGFDLTNYEQLKEACRYINLQPMWASENISKGGV